MLCWFYCVSCSPHSHTLLYTQSELWFYDNYVIPLAKKLKDCGVFGVSSDEYLDYATANRNEWEEKGEAIVKQMQEKYKSVVERSSLGYE